VVGTNQTFLALTDRAAKAGPKGSTMSTFDSSGHVGRGKTELQSPLQDGDLSQCLLLLLYTINIMKP
jgi:hypothetical protein